MWRVLQNCYAIAQKPVLYSYGTLRGISNEIFEVQLTCLLLKSYRRGYFLFCNSSIAISQKKNSSKLNATQPTSF